MNEALFQYLWKHALFNPAQLYTTTGRKITILSPGYCNTDSGPDFKEGKIKIDNTIWVGPIELHLKSSDWLKHKHQDNPNFKNIILHVVFENDLEESPGNFPTLVLKDHLNQSVIDRYQQLITLPQNIPCYAQLNRVPALHLQLWFNRLLAERWEFKLKEWQDLWCRSGNDWRTLFYYRLAANFGFHANREAFLSLAQSLPLLILTKHHKSLLQTEALLFGQSGLLTAVTKPDDYTAELEKEYHFLRKKYTLSPILAYQWKFMRMRPANFPTIRIAQFAMLLHKSLCLFSKMMEIKNADELMAILNLTAGIYWDNHYRFGAIAEDKTVKRLGKKSVQNIIINTIAPMQFLYAKLQGKDLLQENSLNLLQSVAPEDNNIIREWRSNGLEPKDAAASQALIQLFSFYCSGKNCLNCAIGNFLVRNESFNPAR